MISFLSFQVPFWFPIFFSCSLLGCPCSTWSLPWASITEKGRPRFGRYAPSLKVNGATHTQTQRRTLHFDARPHMRRYMSAYVTLHWSFNLCSCSFVVFSLLLLSVLPFNFIRPLLSFPPQRCILSLEIKICHNALSSLGIFLNLSPFVLATSQPRANVDFGTRTALTVH